MSQSRMKMAPPPPDLSRLNLFRSCVIEHFALSRFTLGFVVYETQESDAADATVKGEWRYGGRQVRY